jgi:hypothetical protein
VAFLQLKAVFEVADGNFRVAVGAACEGIDCCIAMFWPGVDGDVALG